LPNRVRPDQVSCSFVLTNTLTALTVCFDEIALTIRHVVDPSMLNLLTSSKNALPSGDGISADYRALALSAFNYNFGKVRFHSLLCVEVKTLVLG
jgi:hypothetical protein